MWKHVFVIVMFASSTIFRAFEASRILCIFPTPSISHQVVFRELTFALNQRGHELVIVTPDPLRDPKLNNYTEIDVHFLYDILTEINWIELRKKVNFYETMAGLMITNNYEQDKILNLPEFKRIYEPDSNEHFDLVIIELLCWHALYPLAKRFDAPWIGITTLGLDLNTHYALGNPIMPSHPATWDMGERSVEPLTFWKRFRDFIDAWRYIRSIRTDIFDGFEKTARKYFGDYGSTIADIEKNVSLIFSNQHLPISFARPIVPNVIEIGGLYPQKTQESLPNKLKEFLDEADEGFVYMSLGSNAKSTMLSSKLRQAFVTAFSKLPFRVVWKFEEDFLPGKPDNVFVMKWIPQQTVLAHPNIRVFIYHGGIQSTEEAIAHAVPLVGIPVMCDQDRQVKKMVSLGVCKQLEITNLDANHLIEAVTTIANDRSFKQRMQNLRSLVADKPDDTRKRAVWWIEHVIRHKGTPYFASDTADLPWYQRGDIDLVAFITTGCLISSYLIFFALYRLLILSFNVLLSPASKKKLN